MRGVGPPAAVPVFAPVSAGREGWPLVYCTGTTRSSILEAVMRICPRCDADMATATTTCPKCGCLLPRTLSPLWQVGGIVVGAGVAAVATYLVGYYLGMKSAHENHEPLPFRPQE